MSVIRSLQNCYWQAVMTLFGQELLGSRGLSLIPPVGLHAIISTNPRLLLPTKSVVAYARKQSQIAIFKLRAKEKGWYLSANEYPTGWEKKAKVVNLPTPVKKGSVSQSAKPKSTKRGDNSSETCSNIVPYEGGFPSIGNIVLEGSPPPLLILVLVGALLQASPSLLPPGHPQARPKSTRGRHLHHREESMLSLTLLLLYFFLFMRLSYS